MSIVAKSGQGFSKESYLHKAAKQVLIGWLREAAASAGYNEYANIWNIRWVVGDEAPHYDVHEEYPLAKNRNLVPEHKQAVGWRIYKKAIVAGYAERGEELAEDIACLPNDGTAPTHQQLIAIGGAATAVVDVAIVENNFIRFAFEAIHKSPTPDWKKSFLKEHGITLIEVRADWIMKQIQRPEHLKIIGQRGCCFSPALAWNRMYDQG